MNKASPMQVANSSIWTCLKAVEIVRGPAPALYGSDAWNVSSTIADGGEHLAALLVYRHGASAQA